jgi:serine/threonine-protein kinase HipA
MNYCPITFEPIEKEQIYSAKGLRSIAPALKKLNPLEFSSADLRLEAIRRSTKISIQGVQPKLSAKILPSQNCFSLVDNGGTYILKPSSETWPELPANEALTMTLAKTVSLEVPVHGLLHNQEGDWCYFIKRFDRYQKNKKYAVEDFAQLSGATRDTKYKSSMEKVAKIIDKFCTFPTQEKIKLFTLTIFSYLVGNEDMHLKNFSLITRDEIVQLSPIYDLLNTSVALENVMEEIALPLNGKKHKLQLDDFTNYYAKAILGLNDKVIAQIFNNFAKNIAIWPELIKRSKLSDQMKAKYSELFKARTKNLRMIRS